MRYSINALEPRYAVSPTLLNSAKEFMDLISVARSAGTLVLLVALLGCSKKAEITEAAAVPVASDMVLKMPTQSPAPPPPEEPKVAAQSVASNAVTSATTSQQLASSAATYSGGTHKFIRTASAKFEVKDVYIAALAIEDTVASHGGFVVKNDILTETVSRQRQPTGKGKLKELHEYLVKGTLSVRVPSAKTQDFLRAIVSHVVFVEHRNFSARDAQFDLLRQHLDTVGNQEAQGELGQAVAAGGKLVQKTDAITARNEVRAARDAAHVTTKELEDQIAFSTIELTLRQPTRVLQSELMDVDEMVLQARPDFFPRLGANLLNGWNGLLEFSLWLMGIWPVWLVFSAISYGIWRLRQRRARGVNAALSPTL